MKLNQTSRLPRPTSRISGMIQRNMTSTRRAVMSGKHAPLSSLLPVMSFDAQGHAYPISKKESK